MCNMRRLNFPQARSSLARRHFYVLRKWLCSVDLLGILLFVAQTFCFWGRLHSNFSIKSLVTAWDIKYIYFPNIPKFLMRFVIQWQKLRRPFLSIVLRTQKHLWFPLPVRVQSATRSKSAARCIAALSLSLSRAHNEKEHKGVEETGTMNRWMAANERMEVHRKSTKNETERESQQTRVCWLIPAMHQPNNVIIIFQQAFLSMISNHILITKCFALLHDTFCGAYAGASQCASNTYYCRDVVYSVWPQSWNELKNAFLFHRNVRLILILRGAAEKICMQ